MATMRIEINGTLSSSKRIKHIKARYFFIKDKVDLGEVEIEHCPTETMWADVLNKPKGGKPSRLDHSYLVNVEIDYDNDLELLQTHPIYFPRRTSFWITHNARARPLNTGVCWVITRSQDPDWMIPNWEIPD